MVIFWLESTQNKLSKDVSHVYLIPTDSEIFISEGTAIAGFQLLRPTSYNMVFVFCPLLLNLLMEGNKYVLAGIYPK